MNANLTGDADGDGGVWCSYLGRAYVQSDLAWCIRVHTCARLCLCLCLCLSVSVSLCAMHSLALPGTSRSFSPLVALVDNMDSIY